MIVKVNSDMTFPCSVMSIQDIQVHSQPAVAALRHTRPKTDFIDSLRSQRSHHLKCSDRIYRVPYCHYRFSASCSSRLSAPFQCPVYDLDNNVAFIGMYQTMTKKGAITVQVESDEAPPPQHRLHVTSSNFVFQRKDFPSNSFYVVVVVKTEDEACGGPLRFYPLRPDVLIDAGNRSKDIDVIVTPAIKCESRVARGLSTCICCKPAN